MVRIMSHVKILLTILFIAELTSLSFFAGCIKQDIQLEGVEVREYQGEKLSSVNDFSENSIKGPQYVNKTTYQLKITGLVKTPKNYTYDEVLNSYQHYKKVVTLDCVEGWSVTILWEGILVLDIIDESEPLSNATVVIFKAIDGYTTSFPLNYIQSNNIILAHRMNNVTIPSERGFPFQLVSESKWGYKWIKWVTEIELSNNTQYKGYWESRGYSNSGYLNNSFFGP
ncbi:MAG: oxidoreductase [Euryarchaeota archaeon RBG_13_31_8]|nr:MAG: oxidoreductase [Euryarchaeota archaeon RBG_13_31_8]